MSDHPNETDRSAERVLRVGVIGLGDIGRGVAGSLALANVDLSVCDVRAEAMEPFADSARLVERPAQLVDHCDVIFVAVINDAQVRAVVTEPGGVLDGAAGGTSVIILSTITTTTLLDVAAIAAQSDVAVVDCGVSGGPTAAASGELICMVGGEADKVEEVRPALDCIGSLVLHMGPLGAGLSAKLARNVVQYGSWLAAYEGQLLAEAAGIDLIKLGQAIKASDVKIGGASTLMFRRTVAPLSDDTDAGLFGPMRAGSLLAHKDLAAALQLAESLGVAMPLAQLTEKHCDDIFGLGTATTKGDA